jgi:exopolysaccharide biosynthesis polyprenyl glycosylphosphotransferase
MLKRTIKHRIANTLSLLIPTLAIFYFSYLITLNLRHPGGLTPDDLNLHIILFGSIFILWIIVYYGFGLINLWSLKRFPKLISALFGATVVNLILAILAFYTQPNLILTPRRFLIILVLITFCLTLLWQVVVRFASQKIVKNYFVFLDLEKHFPKLIKELKSNDRASDIVITEILSDNLITETEQSVKLLHSQTLVIPSSKDPSETLLKILTMIHARGIELVKSDNFYEDVFRRVPIDNLSEMWFLENIHSSTKGIYPLIKRVIDFIFGLLIGSVFIITFPFVALLIKVTSKGTVFFKQNRLSTNGKSIIVYKYRTMKTGTATNTWTKTNDPRITNIGKFLRRTRIDELPQALNLIQGTMSLVGPRPEQVNIAKSLDSEIPFYNSRHMIRPGLTGWAQIHGYAGTTEETKRKLQYDLYYLKHKSLLFDLEIIFKTIFHILFMAGK